MSSHTWTQDSLNTTFCGYIYKMLIFAQIEAFILKMGGQIGMEYFDMRDSVQI